MTEGNTGLTANGGICPLRAKMQGKWLLHFGIAGCVFRLRFGCLVGLFLQKGRDTLHTEEGIIKNYQGQKDKERISRKIIQRGEKYRDNPFYIPRISLNICFPLVN